MVAVTLRALPLLPFVIDATQALKPHDFREGKEALQFLMFVLFNIHNYGVRHFYYVYIYIWVFPKIGGTPKWMVYNGKPY